MNADERAGKNQLGRALHRGSTSCLGGEPDTTERDEAGGGRSHPSDAIDCPMHIELTNILDQFDTVQARVHGLADNLTETRWAERADPARWSVAECVAHLNLTGRAYLPLLREALEEASRLDEPPPARYRRDPMGWILSLVMGPVPRIGRFRLGAVGTIPIASVLSWTYDRA